MTRPNPEFLSLNGPDNCGKTTQLRLLADRVPHAQPLGSVHEHDPGSWAEAAAGDYRRWWFEEVSTGQLTGMLLASHAKRAAARDGRRLGLLDRGRPMLLAVAAATCAVKESLPPGEALDQIEAFAARHPAAADLNVGESAVLLMPSLDLTRSLEITRQRAERPWQSPYGDYQRLLHLILTLQISRGVYAEVVDCEGRTVQDVQEHLLDFMAAAHPAAVMPPEVRS